MTDSEANGAIEREVLGQIMADPEAARIVVRESPIRYECFSSKWWVLGRELLENPADAATVRERLTRAQADPAIFAALDEAEALAGAFDPAALQNAISKLVEAQDQDQPAEDDPLPSSLFPGGRLLDTHFDPVAYAIEPQFPRGELAELVGAHGIFKSTAALDACLSVSTGRTWGGRPVTKGRAVFITMEDAERTLSWRVRAWLDGVPAGRERSDAEADIRENFSYLAREQARELALTATDRNGTVARVTVVERISELVKGTVLGVMETASRLHDGPEMNEALAVFAQAVERIATKSGAAVVIVRHVSKQAARDQVVDSYAGRGGGSLSDAARSVLVMTRDRGDPDGDEVDRFAPVRLVQVKATHSAVGHPITWKPVETPHGIYLQVLSLDDETRAAANRLHEALVEAGAQGITRSDLHKKPPAGLKRSAAKLALDHLLDTGQVVEATEDRPRNPGVRVYRLTQKEHTP